MTADSGQIRARLLEGLDLSERRPTLAGAETTVLEGGNGPPLVLLHGGIEVGGAYWAPVIPALAESRRLIVPDLPGLGTSDPVDRLDAAAFDAWLTALVDDACEESPALIAHSLTGSFAVRSAAGHPDLLRRLVICGTPGIGPYRMPIGLRAAAIRFAVRPTERNSERLEGWAFHDLDALSRRDPEWLAAFDAYLRDRARVSHVKRTMRQLVGAGTKRVPDDELARIAAPVALIWGRQDRFVPLSLAEATASRLDWPLSVIEDSGHVPHVERPQAFVDAFSVR
jgi:2-hydroxymuconate-semialdehyde hydrolase